MLGEAVLNAANDADLCNLPKTTDYAMLVTMFASRISYVYYVRQNQEEHGDTSNT